MRDNLLLCKINHLYALLIETHLSKNNKAKWENKHKSGKIWIIMKFSQWTRIKNNANMQIFWRNNLRSGKKNEMWSVENCYYSVHIYIVSYLCDSFSFAGVPLNAFIRHYEPARYEARALVEQYRRVRRFTDDVGTERHQPFLRLDVRGHGRWVWLYTFPALSSISWQGTWMLQRNFPWDMFEYMYFQRATRLDRFLHFLLVFLLLRNLKIHLNCIFI